MVASRRESFVLIFPIAQVHFFLRPKFSFSRRLSLANHVSWLPHRNPHDTILRQQEGSTGEVSDASKKYSPGIAISFVPRILGALLCDGAFLGGYTLHYFSIEQI
jgi:hypothetical protein